MKKTKVRKTKYIDYKEYAKYYKTSSELYELTKLINPETTHLQTLINRYTLSIEKILETRKQYEDIYKVKQIKLPRKVKKQFRNDVIKYLGTFNSVYYEPAYYNMICKSIKGN